MYHSAQFHTIILQCLTKHSLNDLILDDLLLNLKNVNFVLFVSA